MKPSSWPESPDDKTEDRISLPPLPQAVRESAARALNEPRFRMHAATSQAEAVPQAGTLPPTAPASPSEPESAATSDAASPMRTAPRKRPAVMLAAVSLAVAVGAVLYTALGTGPSSDVSASAAFKPSSAAPHAAFAPDQSANPVRAADERARIGQALKDWAAAWSAKDLDRYFASYASEFRPPDGKSLESWRELRKQRILGKKQIGIAIDDISVEMLSDARAMARFAQTYAADGYSEVRAPKMMILAREGSAWRIAEELADKPRR